VLADGSRRREHFLVPMYCTFLSDRSKKRILDWQTEHLDSKVSAARNDIRVREIFKQIETIKAEMEYEQTIQLYLPLIDRFAKHWQLYQRLAFALVILINLAILLTTEAINTKIDNDFFAYILSYDILHSDDA